ncbi:hypothetical protein F5144DRAFT_598704 [Chaetomium tenue]|uniref:Uncharacterized protein n=1 Tax=Chaetomium tenue TaxID=1854479 RepID=A0ACB7PS19_9PEZI|nr:hypothetical protein F5144DRAFT_598704 [Chaetomium globosum]
MSAVIGEWSGYFTYPDGSKKDFSINIDQSANNTVFIGTGNESRGDFNVVAGQLTTNEGGTTITFAQIYKSIWAGQIWSFRGTLSHDGNILLGEWYDSPADGRDRIGTWKAERILV